MDCSRHLNGLVAFDVQARTAIVQPGLVLDTLNKRLKSAGCSFRSMSPPQRRRRSAAWPATTVAAPGRSATATWSIMSAPSTACWPTAAASISTASTETTSRPMSSGPAAADARTCRRWPPGARRDRSAIFPTVQRKVGGYNIERLGGEKVNLAKLLVGSEGTLGFFQRIEDRPSAPAPAQGAGRLPFPDVPAGDGDRRSISWRCSPAAVELADRAMIDLGAGHPDVPPTHGPVRPGRARLPCCSSSSPARTWIPRRQILRGWSS